MPSAASLVPTATATWLNQHFFRSIRQHKKNCCLQASRPSEAALPLSTHRFWNAWESFGGL
jgi:hypothetical protein